MFDCTYNKVDTLDAFTEVVRKPNTSGVRIIEVMTDRTVNVKTHRALWSRIEERLTVWQQSL